MFRDVHPPPDWPRPPASLPAGRLDEPPEKARICVAGLVIVRQRPGSAKGVIFVTLEDETGIANIVIWQKVYERFRRQVIAGRLLRVTGRVQRDGQVVHVVAERIEDLSEMLDDLARGARDMPAQPALEHAAHRPGNGPNRGTGRHGGAGPRHPRHQARQLFPSRDFH